MLWTAPCSTSVLRLILALTLEELISTNSSGSCNRDETTFSPYDTKHHLSRSQSIKQENPTLTCSHLYGYPWYLALKIDSNQLKNSITRPIPATHITDTQGSAIIPPYAWCRQVNKLRDDDLLTGLEKVGLDKVIIWKLWSVCVFYIRTQMLWGQKNLDHTQECTYNWDVLVALCWKMILDNPKTQSVCVCVHVLFLFPISMSEVAASHSRTIPMVTAASDSWVKGWTSS